MGDGSGSVSLDKWRDYFRSASSDIFNIIEHAILIAASDCPHDFRLKRDRIAEMLFTCKLVKCFGCDKSEDKLKSEIDDTKESKVNSYAEALTDEIEEESQFYGEVLRIKDVVDHFEDESDALLFDCLRKLQLMPLSVEILKATEIGKSVNSLRKHGSKEIRNIVRMLIEDWKVMVDSWVNATVAVADMATESVKTSVVEEKEEEEGLPSPPLDEGAFFATPSSMELSQFFDGIDDDGNPRNSGEFNKNRENGRKPTIPKTDNRKWRPQNPHDSRPPPNDRKPEPKRNEEATWMKQAPSKPHRPSSDEPGLGRPKPPSTESALSRFKPSPKPKVEYETIKTQKKSENRPMQRKPMPPQQEKVNLKNEASVRMKLEAAKRKLQERYQEAENAKKQRTIQVVELQDLPKQSQQRNPHMRAGNHNRQWTNGRR
ncbi:probable mediator of RNA polymerase II transcription subunit 26b isoform X2 [Salvia hispanica]|uniref:probable mediator of RNA polymerase II transcription subunit 26b isoform X2 n=1 Tax=Salvia hispanica TaxID=49212 RepID=UPI0020090286|nr:probable mediator of RNA polymerase II transcription subunit 26b isoform X2 [Salvia hispanica]